MEEKAVFNEKVVFNRNQEVLTIIQSQYL